MDYPDVDIDADGTQLNGAAPEPADEDVDSQPVWWIRWKSRTVRVDLRDFTALDYLRFEQTTGLDLWRSVGDGKLPGFAGMLWLALRRVEPKTRYVDVAAEVRVRDVLDKPPADEDGAAPEA
jgi:hypothetical protein